MNTCVLMAEIVDDLELRYIPNKNREGQLATIEISLMFDNIPMNQDSCTIKAVGYGELAKDISQNYRRGDQVIVEGSLSMKITDYQGIKEKQAELRISRIHPIKQIQPQNYPDFNNYSQPVTASNVAKSGSTPHNPPPAERAYNPSSANVAPNPDYSTAPLPPVNNQNLDEIPYPPVNNNSSQDEEELPF